MKFTPFKTQVAALKFMLVNRRGGLFMRMGTGKTVTILSLIEMLMYNALRIKRVLIVAPLRVAELTWPDEISKWDHTQRLSYTFLHGPDKDALICKAHTSDITAINFEGIRWLYNNKHRLPRFDMLVVDESTWVKSHKADRTKMLHKMSRFIPWVVILTGSPTPNGMADLWSQIFMLDRGQRLGSCITHFRNSYFDRNPYVKYVYDLRDDSRGKIIKKIRDIVLVVEDKDIKGMPDVVDNIVKFKLSPKVMKTYKEVQKEFFTTLDSGIDIEALNKASQQQKLRQILSGFAYGEDKSVIPIHEERLKVLKELVESLNQNVLVGINFREEVNMIRKYFKKDIPFINSESKKSDNTKNLRLWQQGKLPIFLAHPGSIAYGLNLQSGGHNIIWFSQSWSLALVEQYIARLARTGQINASVFNHILMAIGTVDEVIAERVEGKSDKQKDLLHRLKAWRKKHGN